MSSLYILVPLSVLLVFVIGIIFWWSVRSGQYDDMEGPAYRMLLDDRDPETEDEAAIADREKRKETGGSDDADATR